MVTKEEFDEMLKKYLSGESTQEEDTFIERWYHSIPETKGKLGLFQRVALYRKIKLKIFPGGHGATGGISNLVSSIVRGFYQRPALSFSVSMVVVLFIAALIWNGFAPPVETKQAIAVITYSKGDKIENKAQQVQLISLTDGSQVQMQPGALLEIGEFSTTKREVYLKSGAAFFDIKRDEKRPFLVYSNQVTTRVLGTSFTVNAGKSDVTVEVKTGRVSVSKRVDSATSEVILTPNQKVVFDTKNSKVSKALVDKPLVIVPAEVLKEMSFEEAPVTEIFGAVERAYGVQIEFDQTILGSCTLTTYLRQNEDLYERLDIICSAIGATYQVDGTRVNIAGSGCKVDNSVKQ